MRFNIVKFVVVLFGSILFTYNIFGSQYWIRDARIDDRKKIIDVYKKSRNFYEGCLADTNLVISQMIPDVLYSSMEEGFAFVVESLAVESKGQILGFLLKKRSLHSAYRHVIHGGIMAIDPDFRSEMLGTQLYKHLLNHIECHHPDILRVEVSCFEYSTELLALFARCGFVYEGRRDRAILMIGKKVVDELVFVWWNKNFDIYHRDY